MKDVICIAKYEVQKQVHQTKLNIVIEIIIINDFNFRKHFVSIRGIIHKA